MTRLRTTYRPGPRSRARTTATIADVAARAGVGASTVSRVLNDGQVSARARERVLAAMSDLAYRPQASARALASGSTGTVGLVIPFFTHPSAVERVRGVLAAVKETPFELVVCDVADPAQRDEYLGRRVPLDRTDGLLIVSLAPRDDEAEALRARRRAGGAGRRAAPAPAARGDRRRARRRAGDAPPARARPRADRVRGRHERPGLRFVSSRLRHAGYRSALEAAGSPRGPSSSAPARTGAASPTG